MAGMQIQHTDTSSVDDQTLQAHISQLSSYRDELKETIKEEGYNSPESVLRLPSDEGLLQQVRDLTAYLNGDSGLTDVIVVGMGGSARGSRAAFDLIDHNQTQLHTIDTVSTKHITSVVEAVAQSTDRVDQLAICIVSKSGHTSETIANANVLLAALGDHFNPEALSARTIVVSQSTSQLSELANHSDMHSLSIPEQVSGRFSVFSAAGLLPLSLAGININELASGAQGLRETCLSGRPVSDPAAALAAIIYAHAEDNVRILNHFFFTPRARSFGSWVRQLYAESLGKRTNLRGEPTFSGLYPITTIGPDDLHADFQLQLGGPKNFLTLFVHEREDHGDLDRNVTDQGLLPEELQYLNGRTLGEIHTALRSAAITSFREDDRPFIEISVPQFDTERVGQLLLLEELVVMYLGNLLEVNTFNQPQVETYKKIARDNLNS